MLKKMIKTSAVALLLAGTTVGSITPAFAQVQTKDVTESDFLEYIERLKKENPKLNVVEDEPVMYKTAEEAKTAYTEQLKSLKASDKEIKEKIAQFEKLTKEYEAEVKSINKRNEDKNAEWQAEVDRINDEHNAEVAKYEKQKNDFEEWLNS